MQLNWLTDQKTFGTLCSRKNLSTSTLMTETTWISKPCSSKGYVDDEDDDDGLWWETPMNGRPNFNQKAD